MLYSLLIVLVSSLFVVGLVTRSDYDVNIGRVTGSPFTELPDGTVANRLRFRLRNQTGTPAAMTIATTMPDQIELRFVGAHPVELQPGEMLRLEAWVVVPTSFFHEATSREASFTFTSSDGFTETVTFPLLGPSAHESVNP